jgi:hypothetical protein
MIPDSGLYRGFFVFSGRRFQKIGKTAGIKESSGQNGRKPINSKGLRDSRKLFFTGIIPESSGIKIVCRFYAVSRTRECIKYV